MSVSTVVRIGTSGIVLPGNKLTFPAEFQSGSRLHYYGSLFNTLEINSSFYKIPLPKTFSKWATEVPGDFKFTVKLWRGITHVKKLAYNVDDIDIFMSAANQLGEKAGCLLLQFPASITVAYLLDVEKILQRLAYLTQHNPWQLAVEMRHSSWYQPDIYWMFAKYQTSVVVHDMPASRTPLDHHTHNVIYLRFHGPSGDYTGSYTDDFIGEQANYIKHLQQQGKDIYVYFNNTIGSALENAQLLQSLL